jgi:hypothetical protein
MSSFSFRLFSFLKAQSIESTWIKHDFKIEIEAGNAECFYQSIEQESVLHVSFQVVRGDDITFYLNDPHRNEVNRLEYQQSGAFQIPKTSETGWAKTINDRF